MGTMLIALAAALCFSEFTVKDYSREINVGTCLFFSGILFWWASSEGKAWGIGFETITMAVTVVLAVIAILALSPGQ
jgi:hypothetical protein